MDLKRKLEINPEKTAETIEDFIKKQMEELERKYSDGKVDNLDGVTIQYKDWWFNCRPSNTEPLLRLNVEAKKKDLLEEKLAEIEKMLGKAV
jgi:phosphomannomutase